MNIQTMHLSLDLGLQRMASSAFDDILPEEKDIYLNDIIRKYVQVQRDLMYSQNEDAQASAGENLSTILTRQSLELIDNTNQSPREYKTEEVDSNFFLFVTGKVKVGNTFWETSRMGLPEYNKYSESSSGRPIFRILPTIYIDARLYVTLSSETTEVPTLYVLNYLRIPATVRLDYEGDGSESVDCDLPLHTHQQIIDMTVETMWEDIQRRDGAQPAQQAQ